jgi:RNA polymerase-binding protein DksA
METISGSNPGGGAPRVLVDRMRKREREQFKKLLRELRRRVGGDLGDLVEEARRETDTGFSPEDYAEGGSESFEKEVNLNLMELERLEIREIDEALARLEENTYGNCVACGGRIQLTRLRARPFARMCIECKRHHEQGGPRG